MSWLDHKLDPDRAHTHGGTLEVSVVQDVDSRRWRVLVSMAPIASVPRGHRIGADLGPDDVVDVVNALVVGAQQAQERNEQQGFDDDALNAITTGLGDGL